MSDNSHLCPAVMPLEDSFCLSETTACNECSCPVERAFKLQTRLEHRNLLQDYFWSSLLIHASQFRDEEAEKIVPHSRSGTFTKQWLGFPGEASGKESNCQRRRHKMRVWSLGQEDPLVENMAAHSSILAWRILMDRGAWRATVHRAAKGRTRLKQLSKNNDSCMYYRRRQWHPTPVLLPGKYHGQRSLVGCCLWDCNRVGHDRSDLAAEVCTKC